MTLKEKLSENFDNLEKVSILFIFLSVLLSNFISDASEIFIVLSALSLVSLWFVYFASSRPGFNRFALGLIILYPVYLIFKAFEWPNTDMILYLFYPVYIVFGGYVLSLSIKESVKNKNFELLTFLMGFLILIGPFVLYFEEFLEEYFTYYHFALAFVIATILYNDNLYNRYSFNEKNVIKYIFIITLIFVLNTSLQNINF